MKIAFYILIGSITLTGLSDNSHSNSETLKKKDINIIGKYTVDGFDSSVELELKQNREFLYESQLGGCAGFFHIRRIRGHYKVASQKLKLKPQNLIDIFSFQKEIFQKDSVDYHSVDSIVINKEYQIFTWDSIVYLLSKEYFSNYGFKKNENDYECFANYYNSGYEPKTNGSYFVKKKEGYTPKSDFPIASLPTEYQKMFLQQPIVANIIEVKEFKTDSLNEISENKNQYKIDKGSKDGVFKNMEFHGEDGCCTIKIFQIQDYTSIGKIYLCYDYKAKCGKGERVTTYLERENAKLKIKGHD